MIIRRTVPRKLITESRDCDCRQGRGIAQARYRYTSRAVARREQFTLVRVLQPILQPRRNPYSEPRSPRRVWAKVGRTGMTGHVAAHAGYPWFPDARGVPPESARMFDHMWEEAGIWHAGLVVSLLQNLQRRSCFQWKPGGEQRLGAGPSRPGSLTSDLICWSAAARAQRRLPSSVSARVRTEACWLATYRTEPSRYG